MFQFLCHSILSTLSKTLTNKLHLCFWYKHAPNSFLILYHSFVKLLSLFVNVFCFQLKYYIRLYLSNYILITLERIWNKDIKVFIVCFAIMVFSDGFYVVIDGN